MEKNLIVIVVIVILAILLFGIVSRVMPLLFKPQTANQELREQATVTRDQSKKIIEDSRAQLKTFKEQRPALKPQSRKGSL